jgi:PadR family transcriptional regulator PadR
MADEMINQFEIQMRRGLISFLVLTILREKSCHGYKIIDEIKNRTNQFWTPPSSTIYPLLRKLKEKGLITQVKDQDPDSTKKVYEITNEGKKALEIMAEKRKERQGHMRQFIISTMKNRPESKRNKLYEEILPFPGPFGDPQEDMKAILKDMPKDMQIEFLENIRNKLKKGLATIEQRLEKLRNESN